MAAKSLRPAGQEAVQEKGWLAAHKWLILRRLSQITILLLFIISPLIAAKTGFWLVKGNMASSLTLDILPLTDPYVLVQSIAAGGWPVATGFIGAFIVAAFYFLLGGRVYCSWVCPINIVTDAAAWMRDKAGIKGGAKISRNTRYWVLGFTLLLAFLTGTIAWELINPVSMVFRGAVFGMGMAWGVILAIFLLDFAVSRRAWCGSLCPVGAFYSLLGTGSPVRVNAWQREKCDDCMDCFLVCPEQQVIKKPLKGAAKGYSSLITSSQCTNCGRCIDVCAENVFRFDIRVPFKHDSGRSKNRSAHQTMNNEVSSS
ncbi:MAG: quinol dehydrogenase ferredoxin subunit NapH [Gammaproteobacteria bacterium]|nr:MAG: quinol dehydrogenase ferredoxin subunit NapH [Gammaproteobacteria bacterium]